MTTSPHKVILVTGASRGVGHAIATYLLSHPTSPSLVLAARTSGPLETFASSHPDRVAVSTGDLTSEGAIRSAVDLAQTRFGRLDALILNHGTIEPVAKIADLGIDDWQKCFATNFFSLTSFVRAALPALRKARGRIVMVSSGAASNGYTGWGAYGATKAAVNHLTMTLGVEEKEVTTIAVRPGMVDTQMQRDIRERHGEKMDGEDLKKFMGAFEEGKLVRPEDCGKVIAELAVRGEEGLSGRFVAWNDEALKSYRE